MNPWVFRTYQIINASLQAIDFLLQQGPVTCTGFRRASWTGPSRSFKGPWVRFKSCQITILVIFQTSEHIRIYIYVCKNTQIYLKDQFVATSHPYLLNPYDIWAHMLQGDPCHVKIAEPCQLQTNTVNIHLENSQQINLSNMFRSRRNKEFNQALPDLSVNSVKFGVPPETRLRPSTHACI